MGEYRGSTEIERRAGEDKRGEGMSKIREGKRPCTGGPVVICEVCFVILIRGR